MSEFYDTLLAPFRNILGPVYDAYRKIYEYKGSTTVPGHEVSTIEGAPQPDFREDRHHHFVYSVYGPVDNPVKAGIVGVPRIVKMQENYTGPEIRPYRGRPVNYLPIDTPMKEIFVDMPFEMKTEFKTSTVTTKSS